MSNEETAEELILNELKQLFKVIRTQIEMVRDRKYIIPSEDLNVIKMTPNDFANTYYTKLYLNTNVHSYFSKIYAHTDPNKLSLYVFYENPLLDEGKDVGKKNIKNFAEIVNQKQIEEKRVYDIIFISKRKINPSATAEFEQIPAYKNAFTYKQLNYNPTKHTSNSKFEILTPTEKLEFLRNNRIVDETKLPSIYHNDRMCLYYGTKVGNIIRLTRKNIYHNSLLNESIYYRLVVKNNKSTKKKEYSNTESRDEDGVEDGNGEEEVEDERDDYVGDDNED
jgi:DNA-directed RNA polymerase subunit H (RpoH/RPB5)